MAVRDRLIIGAIDLMRRNGVAGTGVAQLLQVSDTARRSLYLNFPGGKAQLIASATDTAAQTISAAIRHMSEGRDPIAMLRAFVSLWRQALTESDFTAGCPIMAAGLGRAEAPDAADLAGKAFAEWETLITASMIERGVARDRALELATTCIAAIEGAVVMSVAQRSDEPFARVEKVLVDLYRGALA